MKQTTFILTHEWDSPCSGRDFEVCDVFTDETTAYNELHRRSELLEADFRKQNDEWDDNIHVEESNTSFTIDLNGFESFDQLHMHSIKHEVPATEQRFLLFPIDEYRREDLARMNNDELIALAEKDSLHVDWLTTSELTERLNDEAYPTEYWIFPVTVKL